MKTIIMFISSEPLWRAAFKDVEGMKNVMLNYYPYYSENRLLFFLVKVMNRICRVMIGFEFREKLSIWLLKSRVKRQRKNPVVVVSDVYSVAARNYSVFEWIKVSSDSTRLVLISSEAFDEFSAVHKWFDIQYVQSMFDCVTSYNFYDVQKYGALYYPVIYSKPEKKLLDEEYDVLFVGRGIDKHTDRFDHIISAYDYFTDHGLKCLFYITGIPKERQIMRGNVVYNESIPYASILELVEKSKAVFEPSRMDDRIVFSIRFYEAICFDKYYISNLKGARLTKYCSNPGILEYNKITEVDAQRIRNVKCQYNYSNEFSPIHLVQFLDLFDCNYSRIGECKWYDLINWNNVEKACN